MNELHFAATPGMRALATAAFAAVLVLSFLIWRRSGGGRRIFIVEGIRVVAAALACLTLFQPEWRSRRSPDRQPVVAVLWDDSFSMSTRDMPDPKARPGDSPPPVSRAAWLARLLESEFWKPLADTNAIRIEPFSTPGDPASPQDSGTDLNGALAALLEREPNLRAAILLGDGDWTTGENPIQAASEYWTRRIPVFPVTVGAPRALPDLALVNASAPAMGIVGDRVQIAFTIRNTMPETVTTTVEVDDGEGRRAAKQVQLPPLRETSDFLFWTPAKEGTSTLTLRVENVPGEALPDNNQRQLQVSARKEAIKVLVIETLPRWEYRFIRNALSRDPGVAVSCLLLHPEPDVRGGGPDYLDKFPEDLKELSTYDVVFIGDVGVGPRQLTIEQCAMLRQLVEQQASGLVFLPGRMGHQATLVDSPLGDLLPVIFDETRKQGTGAPAPSALVLTESGIRNLLTILTPDERDNPKIWRSLPGFYWLAPVLKARAGADVLAVHESLKNEFGRIPLLVTQTAGSGKILFLGTDGAWRWRRGVEDLYHYRFWGQVARWMSYQRKMAEGEKLRLFFTPENPAVGLTLTLNANAYDNFGVPLLNGRVILDAALPDGRTRRLEMTPNPEGPGSFHATLPLAQPGEHVLTATCPENGDTVKASFFVQGEPVERVGQPARPAVMVDLARITRGASADPAEIPALVEKISRLPVPAPSLEITRLWSHWGWGLAIVGLFTAFWIGRKAVGTI
jgi:hypothetical protein